MNNNDVLRSLRYTLKLTEPKLVEVFKLADIQKTKEEIELYLKDENDEALKLMSDESLSHFLDGLIFLKRGKDPAKPTPKPELPLSNNMILKKLKIAFSLKDEDIKEIIKLANFDISISEIGALLRKKDHPNYRACGDQILRYFLKGLTFKLRI
jgi:uncharacterized protein YehS (DUF1456 family)